MAITADGVTVSGFTINGNGNIIQIYSGGANITGNIINTSGDSIAVDTGNSNSQIQSNTIKGNSQGLGLSFNGGSSIVSNNLVSNFKVGLSGNCRNIQIINNTITNNAFGFEPLTVGGSFSYNNILDNYQYNVFPSLANMDAAYNWWGTTDSDAINQTIAHYGLNQYAPNSVPLGIVAFTPYLNESNPQATPYAKVSVPIPSPTPSPTESPFPSSTSTVPELSGVAILPLLLIVFSIAVIVSHRKTANLNQ